jgi:parvulin-like peptidyl-prolyl isomerase
VGVKSRRLLLTWSFVLLLAQPALHQYALAWQVAADPYAQPPPPGSNGGFRFAGDPNAAPQGFPPPVPQPGTNPAPPPNFQPMPPPMTGPPPGPYGTPPTTTPQANPAAPGPPPPVAQPMAPPPAIPGFDPSLSSANAQLPQGSSLFQPSQIVATVGNQYILYGDVTLAVELMLRPVLAKARTDAERQEVESYRPRLVQQVVRQMVEAKVLYVEFERAVELQAGRDHMTEVRQKISKNMRESFEKQLFTTRDSVLKANPEELQEIAKKDPVIPRLAILMKEHNCENLSELDQVLRTYGSSLEKQQRAYTDHNLGRSNLFEKLKVKTEISHLEMINYYREHVDDFAVKARARFEILSVKFANFPTREAANQAIVNMGNDVYFGTPFAAVARKGSQDPNAEKGGVYDWTNENSLASEVLDKAVFSLEPGKLSPILTDERGFHIVRVIERQPAGFIPFTDAQVKIKELITQKRREAAYKAYIEGLKGKTVVWTIYDEPAAAANVAAQPNPAVQR